MAKQHLTPQQINYQKQVEAYIEAEVKRRTEPMLFNDSMVTAIRATHKADIIIALNVLLDAYDWSSEYERATFCREFLDNVRECLKQYNDGELQLKQLEGHIEVVTGIDIEKWAENNMELSDIKEKTA